MAKTKVYTLFDAAASVFLKPFQATNDGEAIRLFTTWVNDSETPSNVSKYPHQFSLWHLGEYDDSTGKHINLEKGNREIIAGVSVQEEQKRTFTVEELITMLEQKFEPKYKGEQAPIANLEEATPALLKDQAS